MAIAAVDQKIGLPIYDPVSKRYFVMMNSVSPGTWDADYKQARSLWYKGVQGRMAMVDTLEVHEFLVQHFPLNYFDYVWIGLRYMCEAQKLVWSNGNTFQRGAFEAWDKDWKQDIYFCTDKSDPQDWAPVAYSPAFTWIGKGRNKGYDYYFMEYPTGNP